VSKAMQSEVTLSQFLAKNIRMENPRRIMS